MTQADSSSAPRPSAHTAGNAVRATGRFLGRLGFFVWRWSTPYNNRNRPEDKVYASVWSTSLDEANIRAALHAEFPDLEQEKLPAHEEHIRLLIRSRLPPPIPVLEERDLRSYIAKNQALQQLKEQRDGLLGDTPEETWSHVPTTLRYILAAFNASNLEKKLQIIAEEPYHPSQGLGSILRSSAAITKTFRMWRNGFSAGVTRKERIGVNIFFVVLVISAIYPDVAAGFLGERSYNQRSIGSRIFTLFQLFFLWTFPFHSFWLLFNWSLERLLGAFVGNFCIGVQFSLVVRDYVVRLLTRRQMKGLRKQGEAGNIDWASVDKAIHWELVSLKAYTELQAEQNATLRPWQDVPIKVRTERYIQFISCFKLGRPADQLVSLLKDDMEGIVNTFEDYRLPSASAKETDGARKNDKGHVEPRLPKLLLVFFDIAIFTYVCYSFWSQPFTFNTVVAYSTVVVLKQTIVAFKRYQTAKSARRVFTNMVSINILVMLMVSTPVTVDKDVLQDDGNMVALTLAMVFATLFLAEPIAPLLLALTEKIVAGFSWIGRKVRGSRKQDTKEVEK